jgi:imidazole glycerol-phosphate synthase subunit HisH
MVTIIDYGMGNLASVVNAFRKIGREEARVSSDPADIRSTDRLVLPGVGAFGDAKKNLESAGLTGPIRDFIGTGKPFLGICLGMHLLFEKGYENGSHEGLGILKGEVVRFEIAQPVPHMGWNQVRVRANPEKAGGKPDLFDDLPENAYFYFDHSYYIVPADRGIVLTTTDYEITYASSVLWKNVLAVQYHPEKSHRNGFMVLESFLKM